MNTIYRESTVCYSTETDVYGQYERKSPTKYNRKCIDGSITGCGNCVGYCQYKEHPGFLTVIDNNGSFVPLRIGKLKFCIVCF